MTTTYLLPRQRSRVTAIPFLLLVIWVALTGLISASFGNAWPIYGPWLFAVSVVTGALLVARWLWPVLMLGVLVGLASAAFWGWVVVTYGQFWFAVAMLLSLIGALSALLSLRRLRGFSGERSQTDSRSLTPGG